MVHHPLTYWLIFSHSNIAYKVSITELLQHYKDPEHFIKDNMKSFEFIKEMNWSTIEKSCRWADTPNQHILTFSDPSYPFLLKEIAYPPPILYIRGNPETLQRSQLAIVGSRYPSHSGQTITTLFAKDLVHAGLCITSGLAYGIDSTAHEAVLKAGGQTIAVLGNGLNSIYPKQHTNLAKAITEDGCLVSEFPLNAGPNKKHFPQRNRIISGLSLGTLVVEAKLRSGSLITARYAGEQGREVFAVPGAIRHSLSRGCHQLLRDGATLVESIQDIVDALGIPHPASPQRGEENREPEASFGVLVNQQLGLDPQQQQLLACVDFEGTSIDEVIKRSKCSTHIVARQLLNLELHGYISSTQRGYTRIK